MKTFSITKAVKLMIAKFESWRETMEILHDPQLMEDIRQAEKDVKAGRVIDFEDLKKELKIEI